MKIEGTISIPRISGTVSAPPQIIGTTFLAAPYEPPLVAGFCTSDLTIWQYHAVRFSDLSTGDPTAWEWKVDGEVVSNAQNPLLAFTETGAHTVALKITKGDSEKTETKPDYVYVVTPGEWALNAARAGEQDYLERSPENLTATRYALVRFKIDECDVAEDKDVARILELKDGAGNVMFAAKVRRDTWEGNAGIGQQDVSGLALTFTAYDAAGEIFAERDYPYDSPWDGQYAQPPMSLVVGHYYWLKVKLVNNGAASAWRVHVGDDYSQAYQPLKVPAADYGLIWSATGQDPGWTAGWGDVRGGIVEASHALQLSLSKFDISPNDITPPKPVVPITRLMNATFQTGGGWPMDYNQIRYWSPNFLGCELSVENGADDYRALRYAVKDNVYSLKPLYLKPTIQPHVQDFYFRFHFRVSSTFVPPAWMDDLVDVNGKPDMSVWFANFSVFSYIFPNTVWPHFVLGRWKPAGLGGTHPRAGEAFLYFFWEHTPGGTELPSEYIYLDDDEWVAITHQVIRDGDVYKGKFWRNGLWLPTHDQDGGAGSYPVGQTLSNLELGTAHGPTPKGNAAGYFEIADCVLDTEYVAPNPLFVTVPDARRPRSGIFIAPMQNHLEMVYAEVTNNHNELRKARISLHLNGEQSNFASDIFDMPPHGGISIDLLAWFNPPVDYWCDIEILNAAGESLVDEIPLHEATTTFLVFQVAPCFGYRENAARVWPTYQTDRSQMCETTDIFLVWSPLGATDRFFVMNVGAPVFTGESNPGVERTITVSWETRVIGTGAVVDSGTFDIGWHDTVKLTNVELGAAGDGFYKVTFQYQGNPSEVQAYMRADTITGVPPNEQIMATFKEVPFEAG